MCGKGSGTNTVTQNSAPPAQYMQQYGNVTNLANQVAGIGYNYYPGQLVAGMTPDQNSAISTVANTQGIANPYINAGADLTMAGSQPISSQQINQYMNPFLQQVGQTTMQEMGQANAEQQQQLLGSAAASGALGGNRVGLAQSSLANQQQMAENATLANINSQGFSTALGAAQTTAGQQLQGGFLMSQMGPEAQQAALNGAQAQFEMGSAEQGQQQNQLNATYGQWLGAQQYPYQDVNFLSGVSSGMGSLAGGSSSTAYPNPSVATQALGAGIGAAGVLGGTGAFGTGGWLTALLSRGGRIERARGGGLLEAVVATQPQDVTGTQNPVGYLRAPTPQAHGPGAPGSGNGPPAPPGGSIQNSWENSVFNSLGALSGSGDHSAALTNLGMNLMSPQHMASGGAPQTGGAGGMTLPQYQPSAAEQIMDMDEISQLYPGAQIHTTQYQPAQGVFANGGAPKGNISSLPLSPVGGPNSGIAGGIQMPMGEMGNNAAPASLGTWGNVQLPTAPQLPVYGMGSRTGAEFAPLQNVGGQPAASLGNAYTQQVAAQTPLWQPPKNLGAPAPAASAPVAAAAANNTPATWMYPYASGRSAAHGGRIQRFADGGTPVTQQDLPPPPGAAPPVDLGNYTDHVVQAESGNNPNATNPNSSATGLGQFTNGTWQEEFAKRYPDLAGKMSPDQVAALRTNPDISRQMVAQLAQDNGRVLAGNGIAPSATNLYLAHHFGATGATRILSSDPGTPAGAVLSPEAIKANPELAGATTGQLVSQARSVVGEGAPATMQGQSDGVPAAGQAGLSALPNIGGATIEGARASLGDTPQIAQAHNTPAMGLANSPWRALANAGFAMMASPTPWAGVNIGRGLMAGSQTLNDIQDQERANQGLQARTSGMQADTTQRQSALGNELYTNAANAGIAGAQAASNIIGQGMQHGIQAGALGYNGPTTAPLPVQGSTSQPIGGGAAAAPPSTDPQKVTGLPPAAPDNTDTTVVGPNGKPMSLYQARTMANQLSLAGTPGMDRYIAALDSAVNQPAVNALAEGADKANVQQQQLDELKTAAQTFRTGLTGEARSKLQQAVEDFKNATGSTIDPDFLNSTTAAQVIPKLSTFIQTGVSRLASQTGGAEVMNMVRSAAPNISNTPEGIAKLVDLYSTLNQRAHAQAAYVNQKVTSGQMTASQAMTAFNTQYPPAMWASHVDPLPAPATLDKARPGYYYKSKSGTVAMWNGTGFVAPGSGQ